MATYLATILLSWILILTGPNNPCIAESNAVTKGLSPSTASVQSRSMVPKPDELLIRVNCSPHLGGQPVSYRLEFRLTDCGGGGTVVSTSPIGAVAGPKPRRFETASIAAVSAATWWLFRPSDLSHQPVTSGLPFLSVKMAPNCSALLLGPTPTMSNFGGNYAVLVDATRCQVADLLNKLPRLLAAYLTAPGRCILYGIQGATTVGDLESGHAAEVCVLMQENGHSNRRSLLSEIRSDNRTCFASAAIVPGAPDSFINRVSVVFVSVSFVLLVAISVSWIVFYYVQRFRYRHAKKRLSQRLCNAAKTALSKIPVRILQLADDADLQWIGDHCAVCIEPYGCGDPVRILPCKHKYHTHCIDQWLLDQRSCPLCKTDILKACGLWVSGGSRISLDDITITPANSQHHAGAAPHSAASTGATVAGAQQPAGDPPCRRQLPTTAQQQPAGGNANRKSGGTARQTGAAAAAAAAPLIADQAKSDAEDPMESATGMDPLLCVRFHD